MIKKFKTIKNLAVFQNYDWDSSVIAAGGNKSTFKKINVIYGRNYSGKTTLSRIVRSLEQGEISSKYEKPEFEVLFDNKNISDQESLSNHGQQIRVFNEDFVKENLKFIVNPDESITPFAILGGNTTIENEIATLRDELGEKEEGQESGFYLERKKSVDIVKNAQENFETTESQLNEKLKNRATNKLSGIKYNSDKFGDQNYTIRKLESDIETVNSSDFVPIPEEEVLNHNRLLKEEVNQDINSLPKPSFDIASLTERAEALITKTISSSNKIEELVKNSTLNRWVKAGRGLHKNTHSSCSFCGNEISNDRWLELESHFDEESEKLETDIGLLIKDVDLITESIPTLLKVDINLFYSKYHSRLERVFSFLEHIKKQYQDIVSSIKSSLEERKRDILNPKPFVKPLDLSRRLELCWKLLIQIIEEANSYSSEIGNEKSKAQNLLRLKEVHDFVNTIDYNTEKKKIDELKSTHVVENQNKNDVEEKIKGHLDSIQDKVRLMNDEEKGAIKVNEYLNNFFGHESLRLKAIKDEDQFGEKKIKFHIIRNDKKAYHLSEGECSLIAFCYFMAKLEDIDTKGSSPIIWIDDPISSLDNNHIFFVYSLIYSKIVGAENYKQLFISTHNLDFLKYLKRLKSSELDYFLITREQDVSIFKSMPIYLRNYVTEFNFLFHQIYKCANSDIDDELQHSLFYNFGNNTRKFLEAFLFYKYPSVGNDDKLARFFGDNHQASSMTDRINNEFSHLEGLFERSMRPVDVPEMKKTASFILNKIKEKDNDQYEALVSSIGENSN